MVIASWPREASFSLSSSLGYRSSSSDNVHLVGLSGQVVNILSSYVKRSGMTGKV